MVVYIIYMNDARSSKYQIMKYICWLNTQKAFSGEQRTACPIYRTYGVERLNYEPYVNSHNRKKVSNCQLFLFATDSLLSSVRSVPAAWFWSSVTAKFETNFSNVAASNANIIPSLFSCYTFLSSSFSVRNFRPLPYQGSSRRIWRFKNRRSSNSHCEVCRLHCATG